MLYTAFIEKDNKTFSSTSKKKLQCKLLKEYSTKENLYLYNFCTDRVYCAFCEKPAKLEIKYNYNEDGECALYNKYKAMCCGTTECLSYNLNGRSYEWRTKAYGLTREQIQINEQEISKRGVSTRTKNCNTNKNPYSKQYWIDKGLTEEEAIFKINSRNRRRPEFWVERGYQKYNADNMATFHSKTFSMEFLMYFKGNSEKEAIGIINDRKNILSEKSKANMKCLNALRKGSVDADNFFNYIYNKVLLKYISIDSVYTESFGKEKEWFCRDGKDIYFYDFCIPDLDLVIEYHGTHVHPKEELCEEWRHAYSKSGSKEIWDKDKHKRELIENKFGFGNYFCFYSDEDKELFADKLETEIGIFLSRF